MSVFRSEHFDHHEQVSFHADEETGLRLIIAIHATGPLGMAGGGCRMWSYDREQDALDDALRLSRDMSFKLALAGIPSGGAKSVVDGVPAAEDRRGVLRAIGRAVEQLRGRYVVAEDVGTSPEDMRVIAEETTWVVPEQGDSGPSTARGVARGLELAVQRRLGRGLEGVAVAIQGVGRVGGTLGQELARRGARLWVCDVDDRRAEEVARALSAEKVDPARFATLDVDVLAPCALGDVFDAGRAREVKASVVAGSANNQLTTPDVADVFRERSILYAPDFVINMGGAIGAGQDDPAALERVDATLARVFELAEQDGISTREAAERLARRAMAEMKNA